MEFDKTCDYCGETKGWKAFIANTNGLKKEQCRDCYRERVVHVRRDTKPKENQMGYNQRPRGTPESRWSAFLEELNEHCQDIVE